jgi:hypothetical protein
MEFFQQLGEHVEALWQQQGCDEAAFPQIAARALGELPPHKHTNLLEVVNKATSAHNLPTQRDMKASFGDPPLTLFEGRNFRIDVLFWLSGVPGIHQHAFSGAFHVLEGSSIHTRWRFVAEDRVNVRLILGRAEFTDVEILQQGDIREILAGPSMWHATYHLDKPSLTVVVRTVVEPDKVPQYSLTPPGVATAPFHRLDSVVRQAQLLNMMLQVRPEECFAQLRRLLSVKDGYWIYEVLQHLWRAIDDEDARYMVLATVRQHHSRLVDALEASLDYGVRGDRIMRVRMDVGEDADLRYLLALLRNVPDGSEIRRLISIRHPGSDVVMLIEGWVRKLAATGVLGFSLHESWFVTLRHLLNGISEEQIALYFCGITSEGGNPSSLEDVRELCAALKRSWLFRPLFSATRVTNS